MTRPSEQPPKAPPGKNRPRRLLSPLTRRILAVNVLALALLGGGLLYLGQYRDNLIDAELKALGVQAEMFAAALGEGAVVADSLYGQRLASEIADRIVRRLVETTGTRARLFRNNGNLAADSRRLMGPGGIVHIEELPPPGERGGIFPATLEIYDRLARRLTRQEALPLYKEKPRQHARDYPEVLDALSGYSSHAVRSAGGDSMILSVAVPVQRYKQVLGALFLTRGSQAIDDALLEVRLDILKIF
ncbi:MAG: stimulus-sensing domain-containing protein, partial [Proteobacteria bacterium]|nr:stimulus-sensing domain-containing protein [Pseudomonadota bacterium]